MKWLPFLLIFNILSSQNNKPTLEFGITYFPNFYSNQSNYIHFNIHNQSVYYSSRLNPMFYKMETYLPIPNSEEMSITFGVTYMNHKPEYFSRNQLHDSTRYYMEPWINGGGFYFGLNIEKQMLSWLSVYGITSLGYFMIEQKINVVLTDYYGRNATNSESVNVISQLGVKSTSGFCLNIKNIKIKPGISFFVAGARESSSFVSGIGLDCSLALAY